MGRIDAHQHFWRYSEKEYAWITPSMEALRRDFFPKDLRAIQTHLGFEGSVAVEARQSLEETRWLLGLAREHPFILGVVGWVDLCSASAAAQIAEFSSDPKFKGLRHGLQSEPDDAFMLRPEFFRGLAAVEKAGLSYDLLIYPRHLPAAAQLAARFPGLRLVLDHLAKPPIAAGRLSPWKEGILALAANPNVCCKVSGMVTEADWNGWKTEDFKRYLDVIFAAFGPERLLFGSDWPVCGLAADYAQVVGIVEAYVTAYHPTAVQAVFRDNARSFYRLA